MPSILCPRHGPTASVLACEHVCAAVGSGTEPPVYRRLGVSVDDAGTVACCACFACADQFELASENRSSPGVESEAKFPKSDPICTRCLEQTSPPPAVNQAAIRGKSANSRARSSAMPIQVTAALVLLSVALGIQAVTLGLSWMHEARLGALLSSGIFVVLYACLTYGIWMRRAPSRDIYAGIFGYFLITGGAISIPVVMKLIAFCLLYIGPGGTWFATGLRTSTSD
jgi:hypothetical protein